DPVHRERFVLCASRKNEASKVIAAEDSRVLSNAACEAVTHLAGQLKMLTGLMPTHPRSSGR
ncbi:MAG: hypothetical protein IPG64_06230, partial [Haliea sp.]|nr:hypothetical protein [Haliea sp.]